MRLHPRQAVRVPVGSLYAGNSLSTKGTLRRVGRSRSPSETLLRRRSDSCWSWPYHVARPDPAQSASRRRGHRSEMVWAKATWAASALGEALQSAPSVPYVRTHKSPMSRHHLGLTGQIVNFENSDRSVAAAQKAMCCTTWRDSSVHASERQCIHQNGDARTASPCSSCTCSSCSLRVCDKTDLSVSFWSCSAQEGYSGRRNCRELSSSASPGVWQRVPGS